MLNIFVGFLLSSIDGKAGRSEGRDELTGAQQAPPTAADQLCAILLTQR
jgi:hypothetical protein